MPLPTASAPWPPKRLERITPVLSNWSAWWTGDPTALTRAYRNTTTARIDRPAQFAGGVAGALARFWWGRPATTPGQHHDQTHVPLAADIARTSADLLFAEPPELSSEDPTTQDRLEKILSDETIAALTGAAEAAAGLGGVYLRVTWDRDIADAAFLTVVPADQAIPDFSWGRLTAVTFWRVIAHEGQTWWRHLERHETIAGDGVVQHGLYQGTATELGRPVPLADRTETAALAGSVDADGYVTEARTPGLLVAYIPNVEPSTARAWRHTPEAGGLGSADIDGIEPLLDNLDEVHASWLRDLRLAKARLLVARYMLDDHGPGGGASFNLDAEIFTPLKMAAAEDGDAPITPNQFEIRFAEHQATAQHWTEQIIRAAGYSVQSFGELEDSAAATATEVHARENRTMLTRGRKVRLWRPALTRIIAKLITVDAAIFGGTATGQGLRVDFPDGITESPLQIAQTALALSTAGAASTRTLVALVHPDWDDDRVEVEAAAIDAARGGVVADPFSLR